MNRRDRRAAAKGSRARNTPAAHSPTELYEAGLQHFIAGRSLEAQNCCQKALALDAQHADTLHLIGLLSLHSKQYDHALEWISRAIRQQPKADYLAGLGTALLNLGRRKRLSQPSRRRFNSSRITRPHGEISVTPSPISGAQRMRS